MMVQTQWAFATSLSLTREIRELLITAGLTEILSTNKVQICNTLVAVQKLMNDKADALHFCQFMFLQT